MVSCGQKTPERPRTCGQAPGGGGPSPALCHPAQAKILSVVVKGPRFKGEGQPVVPAAVPEPPSRPTDKGLFGQAEEGGK